MAVSRTQGDAQAAPARTEARLDVGECLRGLEDALVDRAIEIAKSNGYAPYTTTIRAAWTEAVRSLSEAVGAAVAGALPGPSGPRAELDYLSDPRFARMRSIARQHRAVGITLELYLGLFKHFRRVYLDAIAMLDLDEPTRARILGLTLDFFDESELSITADWRAEGEDDRLRKLQARARSLTLTKDRYVAIFESLRNPAFLLDHSLKLVHANKAAIDLFVAEGEAGDGLYRHGRDELTARLMPVLSEAMRAGAPAEAAVWIETTSGRCCFDVRLRPLHDAVATGAFGHLLQFYDVTAHREATEAAQRAERQMSRFLATMSHEIRTPLHSVLGAAELLRCSDGAEGDTYLDIVQSAGQSLLQTLNNVLDFTKFENGPPTPQPTDIEIVPALEAVGAMAALGPDARRATISLDIARDVPRRLRLDWAMTRQVLNNLLSNAMRHDAGGGVRLSVQVARTDEDGARIRFEVADHGPGLPEQAAQALFQPFENVSARYTSAGGAGLGLAISRYLVSTMAGRIGFRNAPTGAQIWFELPVSDAEPAEPDAPAAIAPGALTEGRCLLVDDDPIGALVSERQLNRAGFAVDRAGTLAEARRALMATDYDAIVVDYRLPDGTGPELVDAPVLAHRPLRPRFVALTANAEALTASERQRAVFHTVLAKPTDVATLAKALHGSAGAARWAAHGQIAECERFEGLSSETVAAMATAVLEQWSDFRDLLAAVRNGASAEGLADRAHRLAGTTAQLGLTEFEAPLRALEQRSRDRDGIADLVDFLDRPLDEAASWSRLPVEGARR